MCHLDADAHPQDFRILNGEDRGDGSEACYSRSDGVDDGHEFGEMLDAMDDMGFSKEEREGVLQTVAAVLHLGNVGVQEGRRPGVETTSSGGGGGDADDTAAVLVSSHALDSFASLTGLA
jgi:myosin heavy subunit